mmetsp:Transcript_25411/g.59122  ORF Transcript_25411/g.59122 Transcript_25411/m.59122 type:complete len:502 (+) Transcript_25411:133-1638(+)
MPMRCDPSGKNHAQRPWLRCSPVVLLTLALPCKSEAPLAFASGYSGAPLRFTFAQHKALFSAAKEGRLDLANLIFEEAQSSKTGDQVAPEVRTRAPPRGTQSGAGAATFGVDTTDYGGRCSLHVAAQAGHTTVVSALLRWQAEPSLRDYGGQTPLHYAASHGHSEIVQHLLAAGADAQSADSRGQTPLHLAARWGHAESMAILGSADMESRDAGGRTPLHLAAQFGHAGAVSWLIAQGADLEVLDNGGIQTPLHAAVAARPIGAATAVVRSLLDARARIHSQGWRGRTALHHAAASGAAPIVRQLLQAGARRNYKDDDGQTPRSLATANSFHACVEVLDREPIAPSPPPPTPDFETLSGRRSLSAKSAEADANSGSKRTTTVSPRADQRPSSGSSEWHRADAGMHQRPPEVEIVKNGAAATTKCPPSQPTAVREESQHHPRLRHGRPTWKSWWSAGSSQDGSQDKRSLLLRLVTWLYPRGTFKQETHADDTASGARNSCEK